MTKTPEIFETWGVQTALVDSVVRSDKANGITHFVFAETRTACHNGSIERHVVARFAIPDKLVPQIARAMLAGACGEHWLLENEERPAGMRAQ